MSKQLGSQAENLAQRFLLSKGLRFITSNFRSRFGEIDLIMQDAEILVFIEVRSRAAEAFGSAVASITYHKQQKLIKAAGYYLLKNTWANQYRLRFDVIGIDGAPPVITWIPNAFGQF